MNTPKAKPGSPRSRTAKAKGQVDGKCITEGMVLELLTRNPLNRYSYTIVAHQLGCSTERSMALLRALAKRKAVQVSSDPFGLPLFGALAKESSLGLDRIRERGELRADHNGALRHWNLCMTIRRS